MKVLVTAIREEKGIQIGEEEVKPSLFADDMTLYVEDSAMLPENYSCVLSHFSHVQLSANLWTAACQAPLSVGFSRQEYWRGLPFPSPRDLPNPGIEPESLMSPALSGVFLSLVSHLAKRKLLELTTEFGKTANDKTNTQKSVAFLYTNNKRSEREIQEAVPFTIASERIKCLGINLPKETKDLYSKNSKMLMRETEEDINRWKEIPCLWIGRISIV